MGNDLFTNDDSLARINAAELAWRQSAATDDHRPRAQILEEDQLVIPVGHQPVALFQFSQRHVDGWAVSEYNRLEW